MEGQKDEYKRREQEGKIGEKREAWRKLDRDG